MKKRAVVFLAAAILVMTFALPAGASSNPYTTAVDASVTVRNTSPDTWCSGFIVSATDSEVYILTDISALGDRSSLPIVIYDLTEDGLLDNDVASTATVIARDDNLGIVLLSTPYVPAADIHQIVALSPVSAISNGATLYRLGVLTEDSIIQVNHVRIQTTTGRGIRQNSGVYSLGSMADPSIGLWAGGPVVAENGAVVGITLSSAVDSYSAGEAVGSLDGLITFMRENNIPFRSGSDSMNGGNGGSGGGMSGGNGGSGGNDSDKGSDNNTILYVVLGCAALGAGFWFYTKKKNEQGGQGAQNGQNFQNNQFNQPYQGGSQPYQGGSQGYAPPVNAGFQSVPIVPPQGFSLSAVSGPLSGANFPIQGSVVMGRTPGQCAIIFPEGTPGVSRVHCRVDCVGATCTLTDLGSSNGTFLNGQRLVPNVPMSLTPGSTFYLGSPSNSFVFSQM